jgi:malonyl-CoA/methylmalonyl-CoA synthetase
VGARDARPSAGGLFDALATGGERPALRFPERTLSYAELQRESHGPALRARSERRVAVLAEPRIETAIAVVAALRGQATVVPINPRSGSAELAHIVQDAAPELLFLAPDTPVPEALAGVPVFRVGGPPAPITVASGVGFGPTGEEPALIVYTSGTTGPPKGAVLPARAIAANLDALAQVWEWTEADVVVHGLPLFHVHGLVIGILGPLRRGGCATHTGRFTPEAIGDALDDAATMVFGVPTMYRRLADAAAQDPRLARALGGARLLVSGSAPLPAAEHARLYELTGQTIVERYGMTETLMITAVPAGAPPTGPGPPTVGPPLPGVSVRLIDDDGSEIHPDPELDPDLDPDAGPAADPAIGEVQLTGPNVFLGYLNRPDATAQALRDGWFATGDMAVWAPGGAVRLVGRRATDLIKSGGYKIGAGEIEGALREHPAVLDAAVTGEPDDDLGERVVAWIVLREGAAADPRELADHVAATLAPHKRPRTVHFLAELPRNELGKVQKRRLSADPTPDGP